MASTLSSSNTTDLPLEHKAPSDRIEGWKSIGAYFGRDRTTVIRWARERNMPVHRMPGGKISTTFALRDELDAWARSVGAVERAEPEIAKLAETPPEVTQASVTRRRHTVGLILAVGLVLALVTIISGFVASDFPADVASPKVAAEALPKDPAVSERYLAARDLTATRNAQSLEHAIAMLRDVNLRAPEFAPGYAALAEALILSREFGIRSDEQAFPVASFATRTALRLDPSLTDAYRMKGFIAYWWDQDIAAAITAFDEALASDPTNVMANFWYGNILIDSGAFADGLRRLNVARTMLPGSRAILTDLAWAQWSAGNTKVGEQNLSEITVEHPGFAVAHDCLGHTRLAVGDYAGYAASMTTVASLRKNEAMATRARNIQSLIKSGDPNAVYKTVLRYTLDDVANDPRKTYVHPVFIASVAGDRAQTLALLRRAALRNEKWGEAGIVRRIKARWARDETLSRLIASREILPNDQLVDAGRIRHIANVEGM